MAKYEYREMMRRAREIGDQQGARDNGQRNIREAVQQAKDERFARTPLGQRIMSGRRRG